MAIKVTALAAVCLGLAVAPAAQASPYVYVATRGDALGGSGGAVWQFDASLGALSALSPASVAAPNSFNRRGLAVHPYGHSVYRLTDFGVAQFSVQGDGTLAPKTPASVELFVFPVAIAISPDGGSVYVSFTSGRDSSGSIAQFSVRPDGGLTPRSPATVPVPDLAPSDLAVSPDGRSLYATNDASGGPTVSRYAIGADGRLTPTLEETATAAAPDAVAMSPDGRHLYVANGIGRVVSQYSVAADGTLTPKSPATIGTHDAGSLESLAVAPDGLSLYVATEAFSTIPGAVLQYSIGADGRLAHKTPFAVSSSPSAGFHDLAISRDGQSLYAANRGGGNVHQFTVGTDGRLNPRVPAAVAAGDQPSGIATGPAETVQAPVATVTSPAQGAGYFRGQAVTTAFTCADGSGGPGIVSCLDQDGDPPGKALDTSTLGTSTFAVVAESANGQVSRSVVSYSVVNRPPTVSDQTISTDEDVNVSFGLEADDPDGDTLTASPSTAPDHGTVPCSGLTCTYRPHAHFHGTDDFVIRISDGNGGTAFSTVTATVRPVDDPPQATTTILTTDEGVDVSFTLPATHPDGDPLTFDVTQPPTGEGSVTCDGAACTYHADPDHCCSTSIGFTASDPDGDTDAGTVHININLVDDPLTARDQTVVLDENTSVTFGLDAGDPDGGEVLAELFDGPDHGWAVCTGLVCEYTPAPNFVGQDSFSYVVFNEQGEFLEATVSFTVRAVNRPPVAEDQPVVTDEDIDRAITLGATDPDGGELVIEHGQPAHGGLSCTTSTNCSYDPDTNYHGPDAFEFTVTDDHGETDTGTVSITVRPVNDQPTAIGQSLGTDEDTQITFGLDVSDIDGDSLSASVSADPTRGSASCAGTTCTYTPDANLHGEDGFAYVVSDGNGGAATATVVIDVAPVNDAPVAEDSAVTVFEDAGVTFTLAATDADGDPLIYTPAQSVHGSLECRGSGCSYEPDDDFHGDDAFTFTVSDGNGGSDSGRVDITVEPINDAPVANDRSVTVAEDGSATFPITAGDVDGDSLSAEVSGDPAHGTASCDGLSCTYTPTGNHTGSDSFVVTVSDGHGGTDTATVSVTVTPVNDPPTAQNVTVATDEDTSVQLALLGGDIDGDALTYAVTGAGPQHGTVTCAGALCTYAPAENYHGPDSFTYRVADPSGAGASATVTITVTSVVDATTLSVPPLLRILTQPLLKLTIPFEARLVRSPGGQPLAGRTITFVTGGQRRCSAVTNGDGVARCTATLPSLLGVLTGLGYTAVFDGDTVYAGSTGKGALIA